MLSSNQASTSVAGVLAPIHSGAYDQLIHNHFLAAELYAKL